MDYTSYIEDSVKAFRNLLEEQLLREDRMEAEKNSASAKKESITVGVIGGDGIGPIIVDEAERVLEKLLEEEIKE